MSKVSTVMPMPAASSSIIRVLDDNKIDRVVLCPGEVMGSNN